MSERRTAVAIAPATADDSPAIARIHVASWQAAYRGIVPDEHLASLSVERREAYWRSAIAAGETEVMVAREDKCIVGWVSIGACRDDGATPRDGEIWALYVLAEWWSKGVGQALWAGARERLVERGFVSASLWVLADNQRAIRFYRKAGFEANPGHTTTVTIGGKTLQELRYLCRLDGDWRAPLTDLNPSRC
jgi:ribosomal protein S18 acetylase RimI-like enzyme